MSVPIRKPLSRKFNILCLNKAGLLTYLMLFRLPMFFEPVQKNKVALKKITPSLKKCPTKIYPPIDMFDINLQLREQLWNYTRFPFNFTTIYSENQNSRRK